MKSTEPKIYFFRVRELAALSGEYPDVLARLIYHGSIVPDSWLKHGRSMQPIFSSTNLSGLLAIIAEHRKPKSAEMAA